MNNFKFTACDNTKCLEHLNCKRFKMFTMGATDIKTNSGNTTKPCKRFLKLKG